MLGLKLAKAIIQLIAIYYIAIYVASYMHAYIKCTLIWNKETTSYIAIATLHTTPRGEYYAQTHNTAW